MQEFKRHIQAEFRQNIRQLLATDSFNEMPENLSAEFVSLDLRFLSWDVNRRTYCSRKVTGAAALGGHWAEENAIETRRWKTFKTKTHNSDQ